MNERKEIWDNEFKPKIQSQPQHTKVSRRNKTKKEIFPFMAEIKVAFDATGSNQWEKGSVLWRN